MLIAALLLTAAVPSPEAVVLGERLARSGTLAALLPLMAAKEADDMVAAHPELNAADQAELRATAQATLDATTARFFAVEGRRYAELLSEADLRQLVAAAERPAAARLRAAMPQAIMAVMTQMAGVDFKKDVLTAFCAKTGKACPAP